jgi:di/tricarboxylate transporter
MSRKQTAGLVLGLLVPLILLLYPGDLDMPARLALALSAFAVLFWTFEPVPIEYTSLLVLVLFPLLRVVPFETAFAAFSGKAVWLVFAGMAFSLGITETPLGARLARLVLGRVGSYSRLVLGLHVLGAGMALAVPSGVVRVLILMPMLVSLLQAMGERPGSRVSAALILSLVCSTYYGGAGVLTGSVPNVVVLGVMESRKVPIYWSQWALYLFPVIGLLRVGCCYLLIRWIFLTDGRRSPHSPPGAGDQATPPSLPHLWGEGGGKSFSTAQGEGRGLSRLTPAEKKVVGILLLGILLWATDALHGIHPAYVGLILVLLCYLPGWGPLPPDRLRGVNFPLLIYIVALFAMGRALEATGVTARLSAFLTGWADLKDSSALLQLGAITWMLVPFDFLMDTAAVAGALTPALLDFGTGLGLKPLPVALSVALGTGVVFIPYQAAPFVVAYSFRHARMGQFVLVMTLISLVTLLLLLPLNLLYWRLIGFV